MTPGAFNAILIIWLIALTALALISLALSEATRRDLKTRSNLLSKISNLRLSTMLSKRNVPIEDYIRKQPTEELIDEAKSCEGCDTLKECDQGLADESCEDFSFCPNSDKFEEIQKS